MRQETVSTSGRKDPVALDLRRRHFQTQYLIIQTSKQHATPEHDFNQLTLGTKERNLAKCEAAPHREFGAKRAVFGRAEESVRIRRQHKTFVDFEMGNPSCPCGGGGAAGINLFPHQSDGP